MSCLVAMTMTMTSREHFYAQLQTLEEELPGNRMRWYLSVFPCLAALNQVDEIVDLYPILLQKYVDEAQHRQVTRQIRESLTKAVGVIGAAKTGNALRALAGVVPPYLHDQLNYRENDSPEVASKRGREFFKKIYLLDPDVDPNPTREAGPDYDFIVLELLYGRVFSFTEVLDILESEQVMVSALIGIDCVEQVRFHMIGLLRNGARRDEVDFIRQISALVVDTIGVKESRKIPTVPEL
ncbi:hypothetical protein N7448_004439 [Penicillium atrosanguineum]|uniref:Uncharacterized protein n=1 Tax=Penicillium atrosanguineum TaxID=1132637 RepID=A0A9W9PQE0_9EURO|nr:uncharacterized protein N7443_008194 [Penicillium atrosanguineum]KAJ5125112.1 hypothetical protein N7526_007289 [Penicillium atrosanguineum]KAJ5135885.1 hypothetical protein N7448_004439 [Penicillium atrosanguineum]KAJ5292241.1 hypothetical protein N7443_008194 [Penicillium atrosanguineum]KAJ5303740.1 hypothetical protein N7476_010539 [Penicillium atrosanguineum]